MGLRSNRYTHRWNHCETKHVFPLSYKPHSFQWRVSFGMRYDPFAACLPSILLVTENSSHSPCCWIRWLWKMHGNERKTHSATALLLLLAAVCLVTLKKHHKRRMCSYFIGKKRTASSRSAERARRTRKNVEHWIVDVVLSKKNAKHVCGVVLAGGWWFLFHRCSEVDWCWIEVGTRIWGTFKYLSTSKRARWPKRAANAVQFKC